ncbi:MAG: bifunctional diaminohydroxyphosphoribosylaminopyrimidine deaminase/5-amino-6-(5-phosphoribosylamino)uracil reductase RibD, partial [Candidatus Eremiobacteraeota bacterium]|nr:bifunctional diaminohydroxyphosphoribosylaminopyrimidine deaminase/5-amino-6-(5-phosphoribosylamino)uracil reductase RibD [Candidatus Eremiobacteraeota bacterium]
MRAAILDTFFMERALQLAARGLGRTRPNPVVGAVIVRDDKIVGEGWHQKAGQPHAEVLALEAAGDKAVGGTLYINLEPCAHQGRTPPCAPALVEAKLDRVVVGMVDPDERVAGRGIEILRGAGISVSMADPDSAQRCREMNRFYLRRLRSGRPFLTLKFASTLDGKLATRTGHSRWITGPESRRWVHRQRDVHDGLLVGINTVITDDPELTTREPEGRTPIKI